jgi:hypothetical protein
MPSPAAHVGRAVPLAHREEAERWIDMATQEPQAEHLADFHPSGAQQRVPRKLSFQGWNGRVSTSKKVLENRKAGIPRREVVKMRTTERYANLGPEIIRAAVGRLDEVGVTQ